MIGKKFRHHLISNITIEILQETKKGYKVNQTTSFSNPRKKDITAIKYYNFSDFRTPSQWDEIKNQ